MKLEHPQEGEKVVWIGELTEIVNRRKETIRGWVRKGWLPESLHPKMGYIPPNGKKPIRWWTHEQVYGAEGILAWMDENDMRPGPMFSDPEVLDRHLKNLRKPKYIGALEVRSINGWIRQGKSYEYIVRKLHERTAYSTTKAVEKALHQIAEFEGIDLPKKSKVVKKPVLTGDLKQLADNVRRAESLTTTKKRKRTKR